MTMCLSVCVCVCVQGYYFTGDGCRRDEDGYFWITGQASYNLSVRIIMQLSNDHCLSWIVAYESHKYVKELMSAEQEPVLVIRCSRVTCNSYGMLHVDCNLLLH